MEMSVFNRFILCLIGNVEKTIKNMTAEKFVTNCIQMMIQNLTIGEIINVNVTERTCSELCENDCVGLCS